MQQMQSGAVVPTRTSCRDRTPGIQLLGKHATWATVPSPAAWLSFTPMTHPWSGVHCTSQPPPGPLLHHKRPQPTSSVVSFTPVTHPMVRRARPSHPQVRPLLHHKRPQPTSSVVSFTPVTHSMVITRRVVRSSRG